VPFSHLHPTPHQQLTFSTGNPTLLGILGFNIPFTATVFCLLQYQGSSVMSLTAISGSYYFMGGIALNIAGLAEFILGNTFPMVAFIIYGCHWLVLAYISDPLHGIVNSYGADGAGALAQEYLAGQGNYYVVMALVSFIFMCGSLRTNVPFVIMFTCLVFLFSFIAAANYQLGYNPSAAGFEHAVHYLKIAGGFGFGTMILGWYIPIIAKAKSLSLTSCTGTLLSSPSVPLPEFLVLCLFLISARRCWLIIPLHRKLSMLVWLRRTGHKIGMGNYQNAKLLVRCRRF
jgi:succinate-acetate transporter protein